MATYLSQSHSKPRSILIAPKNREQQTLRVRASRAPRRESCSQPLPDPFFKIMAGGNKPRLIYFVSTGICRNVDTD